MIKKVITNTGNKLEIKEKFSALISQNQCPSAANAFPYSIR
jgi:hypothetical protein